MWFIESLASLMLYLSNPDNLSGLFDWYIGFILMTFPSGIFATTAVIWLCNRLEDWGLMKRPDRERRGIPLREILFFIAAPPLALIGSFLLNIYVYQPVLNP